MSNFAKVSKLVDLRGKTRKNGNYANDGANAKTDIAIHHSLTTDGSSSAFANYHVGTLKWPGVAYHFVIRKDGTIEWNHNLGIRSYHVGNSNRIAVGICVVGDFRTQQLTEEQKLSLRLLVEALKKDMPNYKRTRGHNEFPGYAWKACPEFDYRAVISSAKPIAAVPAVTLPDTYTIQEGDTFWSIAHELKGVSVEDIQKANPSVNPEQLQIGQTINLPVTHVKQDAVVKPVVIAAPKVADEYKAAAQRFLNSRNYPSKARFTPLVVDGIVGALTQDALIRVYQYFASVTIDGKFGPQSKRAANTLRRGSSHQWWVRLLQSALNTKGYKLAVDGVFGNGTENAVRQFQRSKKIGQDGIAGPNTWEQLLK